MKEILDRIDALTHALRRVNQRRALMEYPPGHPEEPAALKKFREQNPDWRDLLHEDDRDSAPQSGA